MFNFFYFIVYSLCIQNALFAMTSEINLIDLSEGNSSLHSPDILIQEELPIFHNSLNLSPTGESEVNIKRWLDNDVVNREEPLSKGMNDFLFLFGAGSAIARGSVYFILGYYLSENILVPSINNPGHYFISGIYAALASIPMTILGTESSQKFLKYLITPTSQNVINIKRELSGYEKTFNISKNIILGGSAACSASILTSIAYFSFYDLIGWFWLVPGIPTFYVRTLIDYYAINQLGDAAYEAIIEKPNNKKLSIEQPNSRGADIYTLKETLNKSRNYINVLNYNQSKILETIIKKQDESLSRKIKVCVQPNFFLDVNEEVIIKESTIFRNWMGYVGGAVAVGGMYLYYESTRDGYYFMQPLFQLNEKETLRAQISLAVISLVTASSLSAIAAHSSTLKFYDLIFDMTVRSYRYFSAYLGLNQQEMMTYVPSSPQTREDICFQRKRMAVASFAFMLACCDALTLYQVALLQSLDLSSPVNIFSLIASSVSLFTMSFWAVDEGLMNYIRGGEPKAAMLDIINQIDENLTLITDESLKVLKQILLNDSLHAEEA